MYIIAFLLVNGLQGESAGSEIAPQAIYRGGKGQALV